MDNLYNVQSLYICQSYDQKYVKRIVLDTPYMAAIVYNSRVGL